jgi:hypothetical protein
MNRRKLSAHRTLWSVVVYRPKPHLISLHETKEEADMARTLVGKEGFVLPPMRAWAGKESASA